jgi:DNA-binding helix-hairpin-helix protein with protein kinase domain
MVPLPSLVTYACLPLGSTAMLVGAFPAGMVAVTRPTAQASTPGD